MKTNIAPTPVQSDQSFRGGMRRTWHPIKTWRAKGIAALRIIFGLIWAINAWFKWNPTFQSKIADTVTGSQDGQPGPIQAWITFWGHLVSADPVLFARILATTETALAVLLILG